MAYASPASARTAHVPISPSLSAAPSQSTSGHSRLNIVSRLAIEGKVKQASDSASIKLHMKLTIPVDSVNPGQIIPLFAEENVKIRDYGVHPIDFDSAPYNFSSTTNPLLHSTARALHLPSRTSKSYLSLFENVSHTTPSRSANGSAIPPLEERYTGYFLISGYNVCFVLPKEFPPKHKPRTSEDDSDSERAPSRSHSRTPHRGRRNSVIERNSLQFMAGLALSVPFTSKPPRSPYLLSIPIPRCLSNTIKVRLPPPAPVSTSFASLSSDEDSGGWDLATEPPVTRVAKPISRSNYSEFADDESSESSVGSENCMIQGTFTSSDHVTIRWANPLRMQEFPDHGDGRRRVGVTDVQGIMTCTILSYLHDAGVRMRLDYQGTCTGIWFPGVAVLVGLDVGLDAQGCRVTWAPESSGRWSVDGDAALTGFSIGLPRHPLSPENAFDLPHLDVRQAAGSPNRFSREAESPTGAVPSNDSLLRTPLPQQAMMESYEDSSTPTTSGLPSATTSLTRSSLAFGISESIPRPPSTPVTIHLDLNNLVPSSRNKLAFNISGTVIVSRAHSMTHVETSFDDEETLALPVFRVFSAESESVSTTIRNLCDSVNVEVLEPSDNLATSSHGGKKRVIPSGSQVKCSLERSEILVRPLGAPPPAAAEHSLASSAPRERDRKGHAYASASGSRPTSPDLAGILTRERSSSHLFRDGPLVIPWVNADVVPICPAREDEPWSYAVTLSLPTPVDGPSEWLEFGLAMPVAGLADSHLAGASSSSSTSTPIALPSVNILCASVNGVPVRFEKFEQPRSTGAESPAANLGYHFENLAGEKRRRWLCWIRVRVALAGALEVVYTVSQNTEEAAAAVATRTRTSAKALGKRRAGKEGEGESSSVLIPAFSLPVSRLEITLRRSSDVTTNDPAVDTTLLRKVTRYNVEPFAAFSPPIPLPPHPYLTSSSSSSSSSSTTAAAKQRIRIRICGFSGHDLLGLCRAALPYLLLAVLLNHTIGTRVELREMRAVALAGGGAGMGTGTGPSQLAGAAADDVSHVSPGARTVTHTVWSTSTSTVTVSACAVQGSSSPAGAPAPSSSSGAAGKKYGHTYTVSYASPVLSSAKSGSEQTVVGSGGSSSSSQQRISRNVRGKGAKDASNAAAAAADDHDDDDDDDVYEEEEHGDDARLRLRLQQGQHRGRDERSLMPILHSRLIAWPSLKLDFDYESYASAKSRVMHGWGRVWRVVEIILHWPLPVDAEE